MWECLEEKVSKRMNEWKVTQIMLFQFSFIYPRVILVLLSGCLVRVSASFISVSIFPAGMILKGFYLAITPYSYLRKTDSHMHGTHKRARNSLSLHTQDSHSHVVSHKHINGN